MSAPGGAYGGGGAPPPGGRPRQESTNGLAIASLILGITWLGWIGSVLAIVFGHVALHQIKRTGQDGRGLAIAGLVLGYIGVLVGAVVLVFLVALAKDAEEKRTSVVFEADGSDGAVRGDVTYSFDTDTAQANGRSLPWRKAESRDIGGFDVITLDVQNAGARGSVTCRIRANGKVVSRNTSVGPYAIASCSYNRLSD